jgi:hypothetical protein
LEFGDEMVSEELQKLVSSKAYLYLAPNEYLKCRKGLCLFCLFPL